MDGALGDAHLHRPPRRFVRTSTLTSLSLSSPIGTPSPTLSTVVSPHATRSHQLMCVIHTAPETSILVERALHQAWRAVAASPLQAAVASPRGLLRHCFLTAADHVPDLIVDSSLRVSRTSYMSSSPSLSSTAAAPSGSFGLVLESLGSPPCFV